MPPRSPTPAPHAQLRPYWRGLALCAILLAGYIAIIMALHTETAARSTAPPWYSWLRFPPTRTRLQSIFLVVPAIVFAAWVLTLRRMLGDPTLPTLPSPGTADRRSPGEGQGGGFVGQSLFDPHPCPPPAYTGRGKYIPLIAFLFVIAINATTAMMDGTLKAIWKPFDWPGSEYFSDVPAVKAIAPFLRGYIANLWHYSIHTRTHPPGAVILLYLIGRSIAPGIAVAAWCAIIITATAIIPFYLLSRRLAGRRVAILAVGLYALAPSLVIFGATSMDGIFLAPLIWSMYFLERTISERRLIHAILAGGVLSISLFFSYVTVCVVAMMLVYAILKCIQTPSQAIRIVGLLSASAAVIFASFAILYLLTGFNYLACLHMSRHYDHYAMRTFTISFGRYIDISLDNLMAFLVGVGLPVVVIWCRKTTESIHIRTDIDRFNLAAVISILVFSFVRLFTHETERVWLFFIPPAMLAAASWIAARQRDERPLLEWAMCLLFAQTWLFQLLLFTIW